MESENKNKMKILGSTRTDASFEINWRQFQKYMKDSTLTGVTRYEDDGTSMMFDKNLSYRFQGKMFSAITGSEVIYAFFDGTGKLYALSGFDRGISIIDYVPTGKKETKLRLHFK